MDVNPTVYRVFFGVLVVEALLIGLPGYLFFASAFAGLTLAAAPVLLVAFMPSVLEKAARALSPPGISPFGERETRRWRMPVSWYGHVEFVVLTVVALIFVAITFGFVLVGFINCTSVYPAMNTTLAAVCGTSPLPPDAQAFRAFQQAALCTGDRALSIAFLIVLGVTALTLVAFLIYQNTRSTAAMEKEIRLHARVGVGKS